MISSAGRFTEGRGGGGTALREGGLGGATRPAATEGGGSGESEPGAGRGPIGLLEILGGGGVGRRLGGGGVDGDGLAAGETLTPV